MNIFFQSSIKPQKLFRKHQILICRQISGLNLWGEELTPEVKHKIENFWSSKIQTENYNENDPKNKYYVLSMFPYPSGNLHMGHVRVYTISDAVARFQRMNGKNVIHPIGWDAFGLPAENAAIERNIPPDVWTKQNIEHMKEQLKQLGCSFEWNREFATSDPLYYKWTQDLFLKFFDAGLVYQKEALVNWDPVDKTVLADEQVDENGCSWRSGAKVEKKLLRQWFIRTTKFAKNLLDGLDDPVLQDWKDIIKLQKHWIGECNGVLFDFKLTNTREFISLWTDKPEHLEEVKFIALSKENILSRSAGEIIQMGIKKLLLEAINPINNNRIPIYVTDEIEYLPNTDSHLGIPGINDRDKIFAEKLNIPFNSIDFYVSEEKLKIKQNDICKKAQELNVGGFWTSAKLKDWLISRQRYWGTPIPIIHCETCGTVPVAREDLPVKLPKLTKSSEKGGSLLKDCTEWLNTQCPKCKGPAKRETDTMDTFVDSSWYYLRYVDPTNNKEMFSPDKTRTMTPVDLYIGGKEHAVLHLYYARFVSHFLHSLGLLPEREPFKRLLVQGMVMGRSYRVKKSGQYLLPSQVNVIDVKKNKAVDKISGLPVVMQWEKMSKSKYNGVDPNEMFKQYSVDTIRLLLLADVAPTSHRNWNSNTFPGVLSWQRRLWLTIQDFIKHKTNETKTISESEFQAQEDYMFDSRNYYIKGVTFNYCLSQQISVAISKMQGLTNSIRKAPPAVFAKSLQFERALACQIIMLAPIAPHFASELWTGFLSAPNRLNNSNEVQWDKSVLEQTWPDVDYEYNLDLVCQINGSDQAVIKIPRKEIEQISKEEAIEKALQQKEIQAILTARGITNISFSTHKGFDRVVNITTTAPIKELAVENV